MEYQLDLELDLKLYGKHITKTLEPTTDELIELLPDVLRVGAGTENKHYLRISPKKWHVSYGCMFHDLRIEKDPKLSNAAAKMLLWLEENKYLEKR